MSKLYGAVLAGGKGKRIGGDKSMMRIGAKYPWQSALQLLEEFCDSTFISCRRDQVSHFHGDVKLVLDQYDDHGPAGALLSLHQQEPGASWFVLPCDLPGVHRTMIHHIQRERKTDRDFTVAYNVLKDDVEPLIGIWESHSFARITSMHMAGEYSIRKYLKSLKGHFVSINDEEGFININTTEDLNLYAKRDKNHNDRV